MKPLVDALEGRVRALEAESAARGAALESLTGTVAELMAENRALRERISTMGPWLYALGGSDASGYRSGVVERLHIPAQSWSPAAPRRSWWPGASPRPETAWRASC